MNDSQKNVLSWISKLKRNIFVMFKNLYCDNITTTTALVWQTEFEIDTHFTPCFYVYTLPISMRSRKKYRIISSRDTIQSSSIIITVSQWELTADAITPSTWMCSSIHARSTCRLYHVNRAAITGDNILAPLHEIKWQQLNRRLSTRRWNLWVSDFQMIWNELTWWEIVVLVMVTSSPFY